MSISVMITTPSRVFDVWNSCKRSKKADEMIDSHIDSTMSKQIKIYHSSSVHN